LTDQRDSNEDYERLSISVRLNQGDLSEDGKVLFKDVSEVHVTVFGTCYYKDNTLNIIPIAIIY
jgi:hypothetical protein